MGHVMEDISVSVTRAFRPDGTTYPVFWEVRNSAMGESLFAGIRDGGDATEFTDPTDTSIDWTAVTVMKACSDSGLITTDAARITHWLIENSLITR